MIVGEGVCTINAGDVVIGIIDANIYNQKQSGCSSYCILDESCASKDWVDFTYII